MLMTKLFINKSLVARGQADSKDSTIFNMNSSYR